MWCIKRWHCRWPWMTFEGHFSCRNHLNTNTSVTYYAPDLRREGALSVDGRRVCLSVPCLDLGRELKGPGSLYLAPWKSMTRVTREPVSKSKGQRSRSPGRLQLTDWMRRIFRTRRPTNFKLGRRTEPRFAKVTILMLLLRAAFSD